MMIDFFSRSMVDPHPVFLLLTDSVKAIFILSGSCSLIAVRMQDWARRRRLSRHQVYDARTISARRTPISRRKMISGPHPGEFFLVPDPGRKRSLKIYCLLQLCQKIFLVEMVLGTSVGNGVEATYWASNTQHPVAEKYGDCPRPMVHQIGQRQVGVVEFWFVH